MKNDWLTKRALFSILQDAQTDLMVCLSEASEVNELDAEIERLRAEVVFIGESTPMASNGNITQLLRTRPNLKVIVVSEQSNWVHIFRRDDILLGSLPEFMHLIQEAVKA
jgi:DNA-binding NarL/FixJ family response regulator